MDDLANTTDTGKTTEQAAPNQGQAQRDDKGRFGKGNRGGPGNPFARQTAKLRQAALQAVSDDDIHEIVEALKVKAKKGDVAASKLLLSYTIGKPTTAPDPDTLNQHEFQTIVNNHVTSTDGASQVIEGMPIDALLTILRALIPVLLTSKLKMAKEVLTAPPADEDDDFPELELESAMQAAAGASENTTAAARNDNIPPWMHEIVNADRAQRNSAAEKPQGQENGSQQAKTLDEIEMQLRALMNIMQKQHSSGHEAENNNPSQNPDGDLLHGPPRTDARGSVPVTKRRKRLVLWQILKPESTGAGYKYP